MTGSIPQNKHTIGLQGENKAAEFLESRGFNIVERNYRYGKRGEIDIIAEKKGLLLFIEVKSRNVSAFGGPLYSISVRKKKAIQSTALHYLRNRGHDLPESYTCRFDMIAVENDEISWHEDIFR